MATNPLLLSVVIEHEFFGDARLRGLRIEPAAVTAALLRRPGLDHRIDGVGVRVLYDEERLDALELLAADGDGSLEFWFKGYASDHAVAQCSEAFVRSEGSTVLLDSDRSGTDASGRRTLHPGERVAAPDMIALDDPRLEGVLDSSDRRVPPLFVMHVRYGGKGRQELATRLQEPAAEYVACFGARRTYWKYYLLGQLRSRELDVVDLDGRLRFEAVGETSLADKRPALAFRSSDAIALRERSPYRFQLKEQGSGNGRVLVRRLPVASTGPVSSEVIEGQVVHVSEIYING